MPRQRLGVALLVPPPLDREVDALRRALGDPALHRIPPHLTLAPPVNVREERVDDAVEVVRRAAAAAGPVTVGLGPPRSFLPDSPVVHLPVGAGEERVRALRDAVFHEPLQRPLAWPYVPHVTLAADVEPARVEAAVTALRSYRADVTFTRVHVLREEHGPERGRVWEPLAGIALERPPVIGRGGLELELTHGDRLGPEAARFAEQAWADHDLAEIGDVPVAARPLAVTARREGGVVGVVVGRLGDEAHLSELIVAPEARGEGIGSQLLAAFESAAAEAGCTRLTLRTDAAGAARGFYEHRGWRAGASLPRWRAGRDYVQMERNLR